MDSNEVEGTARDVKGHVKDAVGGLTGDSKTQAEGKLDKAAGHIQSQFGETADKVRDAASDVSGTASEYADKASSKASEYADKASSKLNDAAETVRGHAGDVGGKIYDAGVQAGHYVEQTVQEQPLLSLIGVAAIGYLVGFLIHSVASPFAPPPPTSRKYYWS